MGLSGAQRNSSQLNGTRRIPSETSGTHWNSWDEDVGSFGKKTKKTSYGIFYNKLACVLLVALFKDLCNQCILGEVIWVTRVFQFGCSRMALWAFSWTWTDNHERSCKWIRNLSKGLQIGMSNRDPWTQKFYNSFVGAKTPLGNGMLLLERDPIWRPTGFRYSSAC